MKIVLTHHAKAKMILRGITSVQLTEALTSVKPVKTAQDGGAYTSETKVKGQAHYPLRVVWALEGDAVIVKMAFWKGRVDPVRK